MRKNNWKSKRGGEKQEVVTFGFIVSLCEKIPPTMFWNNVEEPTAC
jgi:hypothetical protein